MYRIEFSHSTGRELEKVYKIDKKLYLRLIAAIESLKVNPFQGKRLKGKLMGDYSLRVGDYRVIYTIYRDKLIVSIIDFGHRREIYR